MSVKTIKEFDNSIQLEWKNVDSIFLNTLRRIMISDIPTISIDKIEMDTNTSPMNDEFLAHRIGLIPIICDTDVCSISKQEDCHCNDGCPLCNFEFTLEKENENSDKLVGVYSSDFVPVYNPSNTFRVVSYPVFEQGILLCKLAKGQKIKLKCIAIKGTGKDHSKWSPVSCVSFVDKPIIKIKNVSEDLYDNVVTSCPRNVYVKKNEKLVIQNENNCSFCMECVEKSNNEIQIEHNEKHFFMTIESNGSISPRDLLKKSLRIWKQKLQLLQEQIHTI